MTEPSTSKTSNSFLRTLVVHNTTIIAIILSIAAMIGNHFEELRQNADEKLQQIQDRRQDNEDELADAVNKIDEYNLEENVDTTSEQYTGLIKNFSDEKDSLDKEEITLTNSEEQVNKTYEKVKAQDDRSNMTDTILQISILLSSVGMTNKNKLLTYAATALTAIGVIIIISIFLL